MKKRRKKRVKKLKKAVAKITAALGVTVALLDQADAEVDRLQRAEAKNRRFAHRKTEKADKLRRRGKGAKAARVDKRANARSDKADRLATRSQEAVARAKKLARKVDRIEHNEDTAKAKLRAYLRANSAIKVVGNKVIGGGSGEMAVRRRIVAACLATEAGCSSGIRRNFYAQSDSDGYIDVTHVITGEHYGERSDCSQYATAVCWSADAPDPSGNNFKPPMYTGSIEAHCKQIAFADLRPGDFILYGPPGATHHIEVYIGNGNPEQTYGETGNPRTSGHGSAAVDPGSIFMISGARAFRNPNL